MRNYRRVKTTLGHRYVMRICEDEVLERDLFHAVLIFVPAITIVLFAAAAGVI